MGKVLKGNSDATKALLHSRSKFQLHNYGIGVPLCSFALGCSWEKKWTNCMRSIKSPHSLYISLHSISLNFTFLSSKKAYTRPDCTSIHLFSFLFFIDLLLPSCPHLYFKINFVLYLHDCNREFFLCFRELHFPRAGHASNLWHNFMPHHCRIQTGNTFEALCALCIILSTYVYYINGMGRTCFEIVYKTCMHGVRHML